MSNSNPDYDIIVPSYVRFDSSLTLGARLLYGELLAISNIYKDFHPTNKYLAYAYDVSKRTICSWISELEKLQYITVQLVYKKDSNEIDERRIFITNKGK